MHDERLRKTEPSPAHHEACGPKEAAKTSPGQQAPPPSAETGAGPQPREQAAQLHACICQLVRIERHAMRDIAIGLAAMQRDLLYRELGYAGLVEYGEQAFGFSPGKTRQLARIGRLLPDLPALDAAMRSGALGWTKARTIGQVVSPETEQAWVERSLQLNSRDLEELVARSSEGDAPPDPAEEWEPPRYIWARFRLDPFHFERLMQALALLRHQFDDADMSASQLLLHMAEQCLDGELAENKAGALVEEMDREDSLQGDASDAPPEAQVCADEVGDAEEQPAAHVCCDESDREDARYPATHVCSDDAGCAGAGSSPTAQGCRGESDDEDQRHHRPRGENAFPINYRIIEHRCPCCQKAWTEGRAGRMEMDERDRALAECDAEVVAGDDSAGTPGHMSRTIPPATRRAVLIRDGGRCQVPGCRHNKHIELHHIIWRSEFGGHDPQNLVCLCSAHHGMVHKDVLRVSRDADGALHWERGPGEPLAVVASIWGESAELDHSHLSDFKGLPGSWPLIEGLWGPIEPPAPGRPPHGRQQVRMGDDQRLAPSWMARNIPV